MKKLSMGKIVKLKNDNTCVVVDVLGQEAIVFNITKMRPDKIKIKDIKDIVGEANCTTMVVEEKEKETKTKEKIENKHTDSNQDKESEDLKDKEVNDGLKECGELIKLFGEAAMLLGGIFMDAAKEDKNGKC